MKKFLVIGCGGSGGAALSYMIDQLKGTLAARGVADLPVGWQFVHIDVPVGQDSPPDGLRPVVQPVGTYIPTAPTSGDYGMLDNAITDMISERDGLKLIGSWAPKNPRLVPVPITVGAGQFRSIGRLITLFRASRVHGELERILKGMLAPTTNQEMAALAKRCPEMGTFSDKASPIVLVVSSMAGGAGASMALDVCRLLSTLKQVDPRLLGVFMFTPDVFDAIPLSERTGVRPNSLAMLGEIVAAQTGTAAKHDVDLLSAFGVDYGEQTDRPFARVFPVSAKIGATGASLGDRPKDVFRALGRGLAALMTSGAVALDQFAQYDLGNPSPLSTDEALFGWGNTDPSGVLWGSFGYGSLSMGRDRYEHYAAQRLARTAVDRMIAGHLEPGSTVSAQTQRDARINSHWPHFIERAKLPLTDSDARGAKPLVRDWFASAAGINQSVVDGEVRAFLAQSLVPVIPQTQGVAGRDWVTSLRAKLKANSRLVSNSASALSHRVVFRWHTDLAERIVKGLEEAVSQFGLPYAIGLIERLEQHIANDVIGALKATQPPAIDPTALNDTVNRTLNALDRNVIANGQLFIDQVVDSVRNLTVSLTMELSSALAIEVLSGLITDVLRPLAATFTDTLQLLENEKDSPVSEVGLANLSTDRYALWPSDSDEHPPSQFFHAQNEVLLTSADVFQDRYSSDIIGALGADSETPPRFDDARTAVVTQVITGVWKTTGGDLAQGGLITWTADWRPRAFTSHPETGQPLVFQPAGFSVSVRPRELRERALAFVRRPGESFNRFVSTSLRDFLAGRDEDAQESELASRRAEVVAKFREALDLARPLVSVDVDAVQKIHQVATLYRYKFSPIPFAGLLDQALHTVLVEDNDLDPATLANFTDAVDESDVRQISLFGSYQQYVPAVFETVLNPVAEQWHRTLRAGKPGFWQWRRARPLAASLPLADAERRAMTAGWLIAQIVGHLVLPDNALEEPVEIWDATGERWLQFPNPLLTPPTTPGFRPYDWLPAVLESHLLACSRATQRPVFSSLDPYIALRHTYDAGSRPSAGRAEDDLAGLDHLVHWLVSGQCPGKGVSRIPGLHPNATARERFHAASAWLEVPNQVAASYLRENEDGATKDGVFSRITTRAAAADLPLFADLAHDYWWATAEVARLLDLGVARADKAGGEKTSQPETMVF